MESIMQSEKECYVCQTTQNLQLHHCIYGTANRKLSDKYGLTIYLCQEHHTGNTGVHFDKTLDLFIKQQAQRRFEEFYPKHSFLGVFGKNFI